MNGQSIVMLLLITPKLSIPVGFRFYQADPNMRPWKKEESRLKNQGIKAVNRSPRPAPEAAYPSKPQLMLALLKAFHVYHPLVRVKAIVADALYSEGKFMNEASVYGSNIQVISELRKNQTVTYRNRRMSIEAYFIPNRN